MPLRLRSSVTSFSSEALSPPSSFLALIAASLCGRLSLCFLAYASLKLFRSWEAPTRVNDSCNISETWAGRSLASFRARRKAIACSWIRGWPASMAAAALRQRSARTSLPRQKVSVHHDSKRRQPSKTPLTSAKIDVKTSKLSVDALGTRLEQRCE
jgi:hypothetical protein